MHHLMKQVLSHGLIDSQLSLAKPGAVACQGIQRLQLIPECLDINNLHTGHSLLQADKDIVLDVNVCCILE